jgi:hypothetical protein
MSTDRFAGFQAQCLNVHVDFPLLQRIALPINIGSVRYPGIKLHDARIIRLLEVLLHSGSTVGGWTTRQIHEAVITTFRISPKTYGLNQLRYDLRKLKGHGLLQRDGRRYAYRPQTWCPNCNTSPIRDEQPIWRISDHVCTRSDHERHLAHIGPCLR